MHVERIVFGNWWGSIPHFAYFPGALSYCKLSISAFYKYFLAYFDDSITIHSHLFDLDAPTGIKYLLNSAYLNKFARTCLAVAQEEDLEESVCSFPDAVNILASASEGVAGGSMMACIRCEL